ncbi:ABC transporter permease [Sulfurimonas hongkongensis]|uniref:ABC transporter permease n=1 Tax=Sulfurimonas hongkongensis TaxID=1172190 RepID=T0L0G8_9BACT|nr:ABC transporter permease [Sulfurimonas hongkongensis]EQB39268.1 ABC transporter permease [Sulfurimonas hongkongensis]
MVLKFVESIGGKTLEVLASIYEAIKFTFICTAHMLKPQSYNPAMRMVLTKQIYFTTVQIIPLFTTISVLFGSVIIGVIIVLASEYGLQDKIGSILITFIIDEFSPFFTALLISLRSSAAVNTEIAVMGVNNELNTLKRYRIDLIDYLFLPRIISGMISVVSLSILFSFIMLCSGYIFALFYMHMDFHTYKHLLISAIELKDLLALLIKSLAFGFVIMLIPIYSGLETTNAYTAVPVSVLNGMVKLFVAIFFIEVLSLLLQSL